jgi:hypothetical protein
MNHHICIEKHITTVDGSPLPYGAHALLESIEAVLPEMVETIVPKIGDGSVTVCGEKEARRVLGRKLEDRLRRRVEYE